MSRNVDKYGHTLGPGRAVRPYVPQRNPKQYGQRPLPFALQCKPLRLTRRDMHPGCVEKNKGGWVTACTVTSGKFPEMELFGRWRVTLHGTTYGFTDDVAMAMGVKRAALAMHVPCDVFDMEN